MRKIKFRVWDTILKTYDHACDIAIKPNGKIIFDDDMDTYKPSDFIIEQFTGLHDCEGKEIYEGDIVEIITPCGTPNEITDTVQYNDVYGCFFLRTRYTSICDLIQSDYSLKIIGNIHEA